MTIFERIISGEIPSHQIAQNENFLAFLDAFPLKEGHTLVIPKQPTDYIFDLDDDMLSGLHLFSKKIARAIEKSIPCKRVGTAVIGLEVPHTHIHLIPINEVGDINFSNPKLKINEVRMKEIAQSIATSFNSL